MKNRELIIINYRILSKFCKKNRFVIIGHDTLEKYGMGKNIVYATKENFVHEQVYPENMPLLIEEGVWENLILINNELRQYGLRLVIYDGFRPRAVQNKFWDTFFDTYNYHNESLVANPKKRGTHNITPNAVDLLVENVDGSPAELPYKFDDFDGRAAINYEECTSEAKKNRDILIRVAEKYGLVVNKSEFFHFTDQRVRIGENYFWPKKCVPKMERRVFKVRKRDFLIKRHNVEK